MIPFIGGVAVGALVVFIWGELLGGPPAWISLPDVYEDGDQGALRMECVHCCKTCHVMPGTRVKDAVTTRMMFLRQHVLCGHQPGDQGRVLE